MHENQTAPRHNCYRKDECKDDDGVTARFTSADEIGCHPTVKSIVDACRHLRADALAIELPEQAIVAVINAYDGTYAAATCEPDAHLSSIVRGLQVRLYSGPGVESPGTFLPSSTVRSALRGWEGQIALVFGKSYAAMLLASTVRARSAGELTREDLESIRLLLSSAIGGCMFLEKVDK
jgi:hypothetical protein